MHIYQSHQLLLMKQENQEESIEIQMFPSRIHLDSKITLHSILR